MDFKIGDIIRKQRTGQLYAVVGIGDYENFTVEDKNAIMIKALDDNKYGLTFWSYPTLYEHASPLEKELYSDK